MSIDLKNLSTKELQALKSRVEKALSRAEKKMKEEALRAAKEAARKFGYSLEEITDEAAPKKPARGKAKKTAGKKSKAPPKYANPSDPSQKWSGRGRQPAWFKAAIEAGANPDDMLIK